MESQGRYICPAMGCMRWPWPRGSKAFGRHKNSNDYQQRTSWENRDFEDNNGGFKKPDVSCSKVVIFGFHVDFQGCGTF